MPAEGDLRAAYAARTEAIRAVSRHVKGTVAPWAESNGYPFTGRVKTLESLSEKLQSGRYKRWSDIDDLYACTVVLPTAAHEAKAIEFLTKVFRLKEIKARHSTKKEPEVFRFDNTRFIGQVSEFAAESMVPGCERILFEIQLPTAFEWAWMTVTHDRVYKASTVDWGHRRLAAMMRATVEQVDLLAAGFDANAGAVPPSHSAVLGVQSEIVAVAQRLIDEGSISAGLSPGSWSRFGDNVMALARSVNYGQAAEKVNIIKKELTDYVERHPSVRQFQSGTLFQLVVAAWVERFGVKGLERFPIVHSQELTELLGVSSVPLAFVFDLD